jgi:hypothetical protein
MQAEIIPKDQQFYPFLFQQIHLKESCWIEKTPYFTRRAIGEWLEYDTRKRDPIGHILRKNPHIDQFSVPVRLSGTDGKTYEQKIYNPIGLQLIVFESHQPKAKAYKIAVANLVWAFMQGRLAQPQGAIGTELMNIILLPRYSEIKAKAVKELATDLNVTKETIYNYLKRQENGEPIKRMKPKDCIYKCNIEARAKARRISARLPELSYDDIAKAVGVHRATIFRWLGSKRESI